MRTNSPSLNNAWPIWTECIVTNLDSYLDEKIYNSQDNINPQKKMNLQNLIGQLDDKTIYIRKGSVANHYDLMQDAPSLFAEFASGFGDNLDITDKKLGGWLQDFGPLFQEPTNPCRMWSGFIKPPAHSWQPQDLLQLNYEIEQAWYWAFDEYVILRDTMVKLAAITYEALQLLLALRNADADQLKKCVSRSSLGEPLRQEISDLIYSQEEINWNQVRSLVATSWLLPMVQHYMQGAIPAFEYHEITKRQSRAVTEQKVEQPRLRFTHSWAVPDQWRAMWVQWYEIITNNLELRDCEYVECGKKFVVTDNRQSYCHPRPGAKRSRCQNTVAVAAFRKESEN